MFEEKEFNARLQFKS